jgi:hypothetical protein
LVMVKSWCSPMYLLHQLHLEQPSKALHEDW